MCVCVFVWCLRVCVCVCVSVDVLECPFRCDAVHPYKLQGRSDRTTGCLPLSDVCDGLMYCIDGLDEQNCRK
jgi:hypothetical protein